MDVFKISKNGLFVINIDIYAVFNDGSATFVRGERENIFNRKGGIDYFNQLLEHYIDNRVNNSEYKIIECYPVKDSDLFAIPHLMSQNSIDTEKVPVKTLGIKPNNSNN